MAGTFFGNRRGRRWVISCSQATLFSVFLLVVFLWFVAASRLLQSDEVRRLRLQSSAAEFIPLQSYQQSNLSIGKRATASEVWVNDVNYTIPHRLIICSKVGNDVPYLLEWIEFHRLQGVSKFVLYADDAPIESYRRVASNQVKLFQALYRQIGNPDLVDVYSASAIFSEVTSSLLNATAVPQSTTALHRLAQQALLRHCYQRYANRTEWIAHIDIDEFLYSPRFDSLEDFFKSLYDPLSAKLDPAKSIAPAYQYGNLSGLYVWPVNYGITTSRTLDFRIALRTTAVRGDLEVVFDPRFATSQLNTSALEVRKGNAEKLIEWIIDNAPKELSPEKRAEWFSRLLAQDAVVNLEVDKNDPSNLMAEMEEILKVVKETPAESFGKEKALDSIVNHHLASQYPLIIEDQTHRMLSMDYGDDYQQVAQSVIDIYPQCEQYVRKLLLPENAKFRGKPAVHERIRHLGEPIDNVCVPGELPPHVTNIGKGITWTGKRFDPPGKWRGEELEPQAYLSANERLNSQYHQKMPRPVYNPRLTNPSGRLETCFQPWVHHCGHRTITPFVSANVLTELRLDHHMVRSVERRTIAESSWRNSNGMGRFASGWMTLKAVSKKQDSSKTRFVSKLRQSLERFPLVPMASHTKMNFKSAGSGNPKVFDEYLTTWEFDQCVLPMTLTARHYWCPASHPYTGVIANRAQPPHPLAFNNWCIRDQITDRLSQKPQDPLNYYFDGGYFDQASAFGQHLCADFANFTDFCRPLYRYTMVAKDMQDSVMCPGHPAGPCCDYNQKISEATMEIMKLLGVDQRWHHAYLHRNITAAFWYRPNGTLNYFAVK